MKSKILTLIIGILIGAIIASTGFIIYNKVNSKSKKRDFGDRPQMKQSQSMNPNDGTSSKRSKSSNENVPSIQDNTQTQSNT